MPAPRLEESDVIADVLVVHFLLPARHHDIGMIHSFGNHAIPQFNPYQLIAVARHILPLKPFKSMESFPHRPVEQDNGNKR